MKYSLGTSNFLEEISSLSQSIVFIYFLPLFAILWYYAFTWVSLSFSPLPLMLFSAICKASSDHHVFSFFSFLITINCVNHNKLWKTLKKLGIPDHLSLTLLSLSSCFPELPDSLFTVPQAIARNSLL